jgi:AAA15 family ATPase/GTPase
MLVQFTFGNFKSFRDKTTLSLLASADPLLSKDNVFTEKTFDTTLLKTAAIYGSNASGKSKLFEALLFMRSMILNSAKESTLGEPIETVPFLFSETSAKQPSSFEIVLIYEKIQYRYGFTADKDKIYSEWLLYRPKTKEVGLLWRDEKGFETHPKLFRKLKAIEKSIGTKFFNRNTLLLSQAVKFEEEFAVQFVKAILQIGLIDAHQDGGYLGYTLSQLEKQKERILRFLKIADIHLSDLQEKRVSEYELPKNMPADLKKKMLSEIKEGSIFDIKTGHKKYDSQGRLAKQLEYLSMFRDESSGTQKFFALTGPILDTLDKGKVLFIDELEAKLHPFLVRIIVRLFNSKELNKKNAQLVFATHDTNLLTGELLRRDQIWFVDRDRIGASKLYSLTDFKMGDKKVRNDANFEKQYLEGKYGGTPAIGDLQQLFTS